MVTSAKSVDETNLFSFAAINAARNEIEGTHFVHDTQ